MKAVIQQPCVHTRVYVAARVARPLTVDVDLVALEPIADDSERLPVRPGPARACRDRD